MLRLSYLKNINIILFILQAQKYGLRSLLALKFTLEESDGIDVNHIMNFLDVTNVLSTVFVNASVWLGFCPYPPGGNGIFSSHPTSDCAVPVFFGLPDLGSGTIQGLLFSTGNGMLPTPDILDGDSPVVSVTV